MATGLESSQTFGLAFLHQADPVLAPCITAHRNLPKPICSTARDHVVPTISSLVAMLADTHRPPFSNAAFGATLYNDVALHLRRKPFTRTDSRQSPTGKTLHTAWPGWLRVINWHRGTGTLIWPLPLVHLTTLTLMWSLDL